MALSSTSEMKLGTKAPPFFLPDTVSGKTISLDDFAEKSPLVVVFLCRHCPYVKHLQDELARVARDYSARGVGFVAISANDANAYPEDAPPKLRELALQVGFGFPVCFDESQSVARAYAAVCTPEFFVFDSKRELAYHGQFDESRPNNGKPVDGRDLRGAIDALLRGEAPALDQKPSVGCSIKWRHS